MPIQGQFGAQTLPSSRLPLAGLSPYRNICILQTRGQDSRAPSQRLLEDLDKHHFRPKSKTVPQNKNRWRLRVNVINKIFSSIRFSLQGWDNFSCSLCQGCFSGLFCFVLLFSVFCFLNAVSPIPLLSPASFVPLARSLGFFELQSFHQLWNIMLLWHTEFLEVTCIYVRQWMHVKFKLWKFTVSPTPENSRKQLTGPTLSEVRRNGATMRIQLSPNYKRQKTKKKQKKSGSDNDLPGKFLLSQIPQVIRQTLNESH